MFISWKILCGNGLFICVAFVAKWTNIELQWSSLLCKFEYFVCHLRRNRLWIKWMPMHTLLREMAYSCYVKNVFHASKLEWSFIHQRKKPAILVIFWLSMWVTRDKCPNSTIFELQLGLTFDFITQHTKLALNILKKAEEQHELWGKLILCILFCIFFSLKGFRTEPNK